MGLPRLRCLGLLGPSATSIKATVRFTLEQAAALAVKAGTDLSCGPRIAALPFAVRNRLLSSDDIDRAVKRLFEARFRLGMFDPPDHVPCRN